MLTARDVLMLGIGAFTTLMLMSFGVPFTWWLLGRSTPGNHATGDYGTDAIREALDEKRPAEEAEHAELIEHSKAVVEGHQRARNARGRPGPHTSHPVHIRRVSAVDVDVSAGPPTMLMSGELGGELLSGVETTAPGFLLPRMPTMPTVPTRAISNKVKGKGSSC
jgi:hypothetical protein